MPIPVGDWQQLSTVQGPDAQKPLTIASAATIAPQTFLTVLTGNVAVVNITPPVSHGHMLAIQFAGVAGVTAAGNILTARATVAGVITLFVYNPVIAKYIPVGSIT
jgi:hypothetical protein